MTATQQHIQQQVFPPIIGIEGLSTLINKSPSTILADRCRAPHRVPPACTPPGSKQPLWVLDDVIAWLRSFREPDAAKPSNPDTTGKVEPQKGAPKKRERVAAQEAGFASVADYRRAQAEKRGVA